MWNRIEMYVSVDQIYNTIDVKNISYYKIFSN